MAFNFGAFQEGYDESEKILLAKRRENAALYSDFVKANPGASADEREKFANSLAGSNKSFRAALPSREVMESNVAEYNRKRQAAAAAAARKTQLQNIEIAGKASAYMADLLQTTDSKTAAAQTQALFGDLLDEKMLPVVTTQANRLGYLQFVKDAQPYVTNFTSNPTQANLDSLVREGYNPEFGERLKLQFAPTLDRARTTANAAAAANLMEIAQRVDLDDDNVFKTAMEAELAKYDGLLSQEQKTVIEQQARGQLAQRRQQRTKAQESAAASIVNAARSKIGTAGFETIEQIKSEIEMAIASNDKLAGFDASKMITEIIEPAYHDMRQIELDAKNDAEAATILKNTNEALTNRAFDRTNESTRKGISDVVSGVIPMGEEKGSDGIRKAKIDEVTNIANNALSHLSAFGLNISTASVAAELTGLAIEEQRKSQGLLTADDSAVVELDISHFAQAYDQLLSTGQLGQIETIAINNALEEQGFKTISEAVRSGNQAVFNQAIQDEIKALYTKQLDIFDTTQTTIQSVQTSVSSKAAEVDATVGQLKLDEVEAKGTELLGATVDQNNLSGLRDWELQAKDTLRGLGEAIFTLEAQATRLETLSRDEFYNQDQAGARAAQAEAAKIRTRAEALKGKVIALSGQVTQAGSRFSTLAVNPSENATTNPNDMAERYTFSMKRILDEAAANGTEVEPAQLFSHLYQQLQADKNAGQYIGKRMANPYWFGGGSQNWGPYGSENRPDPNSAGNRLLFGRSLQEQELDYMPFIQDIFNRLGVQMPSATDARRATEGMSLSESIDKNIGGAIAAPFVGLYNYGDYLINGGE